MLKDLQALDHVWNALENKKIILYGASGGGEKMLSILQDAGITAVAFCDGDDSKVGTLFCGLPVISREDLKAYKDDVSYCIIISSCYVSEINKELIENVKWKADYFSSFAICWGLWFAMQEDQDVPPQASEFWRKKKEFVTVEKVCYNTISSTLSGLSSWQIKSLLFVKDPYVAFQPAKVGSSSICIELTKYGKNVIHLHDIAVFFREHPMEESERKVILNAIRKVKNLKIITGVRDPVARDISFIFSGMGDGAHFSKKWDMRNGFLKNLYERIIGNTSLKNEELPTNYSWCDYIIHNSKYGTIFDWFDKEIKEFFDIDIFKENFNKEKGYGIIKRDNIEIFVYKMEKLNELESELREFLEIDDFSIQHNNNSEEKNYTLTYRQAVNEIKLKQEYLDFYYKNNPRMKHFYTEKEIESFRKKWQRNVE